MDTPTVRKIMIELKLSYAKAKTRKQRSKILDIAEAATGRERKYLNKLLLGLRHHRKRTGRSKTYSKESGKILIKIWLKVGQPCTLYLHARIKEVVQDYIEAIKPIPQPIVDELLKMSTSTMERLIRPHRVSGRRYNKRSGIAALRNQVPAGPSAPEPRFTPGFLDADTVSLCGGDPRGDHFWILSVTDVATQMTWCCPCWNCGAATTVQAFQHILEQIPFKIYSLHTDNGGEFFNYHLQKFLAEKYPDVKRSRSRPYNKNDNCRIEQKNYSFVRRFFGDLRFDDLSQYDDLVKLCDAINLYNNFTVPSLKLLSKTRKPGSYTKYNKRYDTPITPWERLNELLPQPPHEHVNAIAQLAFCEKLLKHLYTTQKSQAGR